MRAIWIGDTHGQPLLRGGFARFGDPVASPAALDGALASHGEHAVCLLRVMDATEDGVLLDHLHHRWPRIPVGALANGGDRDKAVALLRARRIDRVIPLHEAASTLDEHVGALVEHARRLDALSGALAPLEQRTLFVTGGTGFLGGHFLRYLLRCSDARVVALTRDTPEAPRGARLAHLQRLHPGRLECVSGDVCLPDLGLTPDVARHLAGRIDEVWHFAAITRFDELLREATHETNTMGTRNVLNFARRLGGLRRFHHVSTAYVAGNTAPGTRVHEGPPARPETFKNPYEESKFLAERAVLDSGLPTIIHRPSIILGERISGLCDGQTVYKVAQLIRLARLSGARATGPGPRSFRVVVDPVTSKNMVPADDVVERMLRIAAGDPAPGGIYHLTNPEPMPMADLIKVVAGILNIPEYEAVTSLEGCALSPAETVLQRISGVFRPYMLNSDPHFDSDCAERAAGGAPIHRVGPDLLRYLIGSFFEQHYGEVSPTAPAEPVACG